MKKSKRGLGILLALVLLVSLASGLRMTALADGGLSTGDVFYFGDTIDLGSDGARLSQYFGNNRIRGSRTLSYNGYDSQSSEHHIYLNNDNGSYSIYIKDTRAYDAIGIKYISGDGSDAHPYVFGMVFHDHSFTYSASGGTVTATCSVPNCTLKDGKTAITLNAPAIPEGAAALTYDGTAKPVVMTVSDDFERLIPVFYGESTEITLDTIRGNICYYKNGDMTAEPSEDAIADVGTHVAKLTFKGKTASVEYTIAPATLTNVSVTQSGTLTYSSEAQTPQVTTAATAVNNQAVTFTYSAAENGTYGDMPTVTDAGDTTIYFKAGAPNHEVRSGSFTVTVNKAEPTYTVPTGLTARYGDTLADVTLPDGWAWNDEPATDVGGVGTNTFKATFTPNDTANYNTVEKDVGVTVSKADGKKATISTANAYSDAESIYIEGVADQEYLIVPKGTAVTEESWKDAVLPDAERENWVFFDGLTPATEYEIHTRVRETETANAGPAVSATSVTDLYGIGRDGDLKVGETLVITPDPEDAEGLEYQWYYAETDGDGLWQRGAIIPGAESASFTIRTEDYGRYLTVAVSKGGRELVDSIMPAPVGGDLQVVSVTGVTGNGEYVWTKDSGKDVEITVKLMNEDIADDSYDRFSELQLDGEPLVPGEDFTVREGSTIITLKAAALQKLSVGKHTVEIFFDNGYVETDLTVKAAAAAPTAKTTPNTGDTSDAALWLAVLTLCGIGIGGVIVIGMKSRASGK